MGSPVLPPATAPAFSPGIPGGSTTAPKRWWQRPLWGQQRWHSRDRLALRRPALTPGGAAGGGGPLPQPALPLRPARSLQEMHLLALEVELPRRRRVVKAGARSSRLPRAGSPSARRAQ